MATCVSKSIFMSIHMSRHALPMTAIIAAGLSLGLLAIGAGRREHRLILAAFDQQKAGVLIQASRQERKIADLADGKATSPILPFLNPIGSAAPHRALAAAYDESAALSGTQPPLQVSSRSTLDSARYRREWTVNTPAAKL